MNDCPSLRRSEIPETLSAIILKLLAKAPEERYQTAAGVEADLGRCLSALEERGRIELFGPGARDVPDRLIVPEKLYGREAEVGLLLAAFDRAVRQGRVELVRVSGYSGVGKSSVVNELHRALVPPRAHFAFGKFDQHKRDIPYATLAQAFQSLVREIHDRVQEAAYALIPDGERATVHRTHPKADRMFNRYDISHFLPANKPRANFRTAARLYQKRRKQLEIGRLAAVQEDGTQNVIVLGRLGALVLRKGSGGVCIP